MIMVLLLLLMMMVMIVLKVPRRSTQADDEEALNTETSPRYFSYLANALKASILQQLKKQILFNCYFSNGGDAFIADMVPQIHYTFLLSGVNEKNYLAKFTVKRYSHELSQLLAVPFCQCFPASFSDSI